MIVGLVGEMIDDRMSLCRVTRFSLNLFIIHLVLSNALPRGTSSRSGYRLGHSFSDANRLMAVHSSIGDREWRMGG